MKRKTMIFLIAGILFFLLIIGLYYWRKTEALPAVSEQKPAYQDTISVTIVDDDTQIKEISRKLADGWNIPDLKYEIEIKKRIGNVALVFVNPTNQTLDPLQIILAKENGIWVYKEMGTTFPDWEQKLPELFK